MNPIETALAILLIYGIVLHLLKLFILIKIKSQESGTGDDLSKISRTTIKRVITKASIFSYVIVIGSMSVPVFQNLFSNSDQAVEIEFLIFVVATAFTAFVCSIFIAMKSKVFFDILS